MLDIDTNKQIKALYKLYRINGGKKEEVFSSSDICDAIAFQKNHAARYRKGLYMEILPEKNKL